MKCLYITSKPIYPIIDGGCFAMDSFLKLLIASDFEVDHIAISTQKHPFDPTAYPSNIEVESVFIDTAVKPLQALKYLIKKGSYNVERFHSDDVQSTIDRKVKQDQFDFIILDSLYSTTYLRQIRSIFKGKVFLRSHNCEAQIWFDLAENERNISKSVYYKKLARDLQAYEFEVLKNVDGVLAISSEDLDQFNMLNSNINACVIPVQLSPDPNDEDVAPNRIFHLGNMDWVPNVEAVDRLINIHQKSKVNQPELTLHIGGRNSEKKYNVDSKEGVVVDGFVESLKTYSKENGILVSPISSSSGVRIKILEMMSYGVPIITTEAGARGIFPEGKEVICIADDDSEIVKAINDLSVDQIRLNKMKKDAIQYITDHHDISKISNTLKQFIGG